MNWVPFGKVTKTHGLKGELKFFPYIGDLKTCREIKHIAFIKAEDCLIEDEIENLRGHEPPFILKLKSCHSIEEAQPYCGCEILALRSEFRPMPDEKYYWFDLVGLQVFDQENRFYGHIEEILETGSNDVYVVRDGQHEILLPAIDWVIKSIDIENNKLVFQIVDGLLESNAL